jgi:hypothetical protein
VYIFGTEVDVASAPGPPGSRTPSPPAMLEAWHRPQATDIAANRQRVEQAFHETCSQQSSVRLMGRVEAGVLRGFKEGFEGVLPAHCGTDSTSP